MDVWIDLLSSVLLERSAEELFGAILLGLLLSGIVGQVGLWVCRIEQEQLARMMGLMLVLALLSMTIGATYVHSQGFDDPDPGFEGMPHMATPWGPYPGPRHAMPYHLPHPLEPSYPRMLAALDIDGDGIVSAEELEQAARSLGTIEQLTPPFARSPGGPPGSESGVDGRQRPSRRPRAQDLRDFRDQDLSDLQAP